MQQLVILDYIPLILILPQKKLRNAHILPSHYRSLTFLRILISFMKGLV